MTQRVVGANGNWIRRSGFLLSLVIAVAADIGLVKTVLAVHDTGRFELDGNATSVSADDWDRVCHQVTGSDCSTTSDTNGASAVSWIATNLARFDIFTGGGTKDPQDLDQWAWKNSTGTLPDKDTLLHGFAVRYKLPATNPATGPNTCSNGTGGPGQPAFDPSIPCDVLFFGSDRFDNSGDAQQGFWFFQNPVSLGSNSVGGGQGFNGVHKAGDLLVVSDFSNGGTTSTISIYKWDPTCRKTTGSTAGTCGDANLRILRTSDSANCASAGASDEFCGLVNANTIKLPWSFTDKSTTGGAGSNQALNGEFLEAGVNLSVLGLGDRCFASFLDETRASTSTTSVLKAFVLGGFGACTAGLTTTPKDGSGNDIDANGLSIGTGSLQVKDSGKLVITGTTVWSGTLKYFLCEPGAGLCTTGGTQIGAAKNVDNTTPQPILSDPATITSVGTYCWRGEFTPTPGLGLKGSTDASAGECFTVNPVTPLVPTLASGPVQLPNGEISDDVTLTGTATRPGSPAVNGPAGARADGTLTFRLYGPDDAQCSSNSLVFTSAAIPVSGDGTYSSGTFKPTKVGTYRWVVSYSGSLPNTTSNAGVCNDANELVLVTDTTSATSAQTWLPNDSATITSGGSTALNGTVVATLHEGLDCTGNTLYTEPTVTFTAKASPATTTTHNTSVTVTVSKAVSWLTVFTSSDPNVSGTTKCENTSLTINNNP